jgi:hypothetical protein
MLGSGQLTFIVVTVGLDYIRAHGPNAHLIPDEFVYSLTGVLGLSVGRIDWIDGDRLQMHVVRQGPTVY